MGKIIETIRTGSLDELVKALQRFPAEMEIDLDGGQDIIISHVVPDEGEDAEFQREYLLIEAE